VLNGDPAALPQKDSPQFSVHMCCGQMAGRIKMSLSRDGGRSRPKRHCARLGPSSSPKGGGAPQFSAHICCDQMAGWIKMLLRSEVGLSPSDVVLDGDPALPPQTGAEPPIFGPCLLWPNGWMDQNATWYGSRPQLRPHCVRRGLAPPLAAKGAQQPASFWPISIVATVAHLSYC